MFVRNFSISLASILVSLLIAELVIRVTGQAPRILEVRIGRYQLSSNPLLGYEPSPGVDYQGQNLYNYDWRGKVTRLGYRSNDYPLVRSPDTLRIAVLGDSVAAGLWVEEYRDTFPGVLENTLKDRSIKAEVLNFGVVGYNTRQEVQTLQDKALQYDPDIVVIAYILNDRERNDGLLLNRLLNEEKKREGLSPTVSNTLLEASALARYLRFRVAPRLLRSANRSDTQLRYNMLADDTVAESFHELGKLQEQYAFTTLVTVFPRFTQANPYPYQKEHETIRQIAAKHNFLYLDLSSAFGNCASTINESLNFDEYHPTKEGHHCAGQAIAEFILASQL